MSAPMTRPAFKTVVALACAGLVAVGGAAPVTAQT